jgi:hypothetical protein
MVSKTRNSSCQEFLSRKGTAMVSKTRNSSRQGTAMLPNNLQTPSRGKGQRCC